MKTGPHESLPPDEAKRIRLTLLSHDIRSAVSDVLGGLRLVDYESLDKSTAEHFGRIRTASELLARLLENAADAFLGESAMIDPPDQIVSLSRLSADIQARWSAIAREKGIEFEISVSSNLPDQIGVERLELERILSNLLGNAIKFTDAGKVRLRIEKCSAQGLLFFVSDTGPGFSQEALDMLFEFDGRPAENEKPGSGLGLYIAKQMADQLGAELLVQNTGSNGALTILSIPKTSFGIIAPLPLNSEPLPEFPGLRVLLAEDNRTNQLVASAMLRRLGAECTIADDGIRALHLLRQGGYDIALVDVEMPKMNGLDVMRELRRHEESNTIPALPVLAVTAFVLRANREAIFAAGADGIIAKPITAIEQFAGSIADVLQRPIIGSDGPDVPIDRDQFQRLLELSGTPGSEELLSRLRNDFSNVRTGLFRALSSADAKMVRSHAHVLISLAGSVGATSLLETARLLHDENQLQIWNDMEKHARQATDGITRVMAQVSSEYRKRFGVT